MSIVDRIREAAKKKGITIPQLERELGFGNRSVYKWDKNSPSIDKIISVANFLNTSVSWIATGKDDSTNPYSSFLCKYEKLSDLDKIKIDHFMEICLVNIPSAFVAYDKEESSLSKNNTVQEASIPYGTSSKDIAILGYVAAGQPIEGISIPIGYISAPVDADYVLIAKGHSMEPVIQDGEHVFVRNCDTLNIGEIGIFYIDGDVTCKRYSISDSEVILKSLNPDFTPFKYSLNELHEFKIQGKVILTNEQKQRFPR